jgi:hypothetical protein
MQNKIKKIFHAILLVSAITPALFGFMASAPVTYAETATKDSRLAQFTSSFQQGQICAPDHTVAGSKFNLTRCINNIYIFSFVLAGFVGVLFFVIAGYMYMLGTPDMIKKAKKLMSSVVMCLGILLIIFPFLNTLNPRLTETQQSIPTISCNDTDLEKADGTISRTICDLPISPGAAVARSGDDDGENKEGRTYLSSKVDYTIGSVAGRNPAAEIKAKGCLFQTDAIERAAGDMVIQLFDKLLSICDDVKKQGMSAQISSISGGVHSAHSYHYVGCAVDFAGNDPQFTKSSTGRAILAAAKREGFSTAPTDDKYRINPGSDYNQTRHIHLDLGTACPNDNGSGTTTGSGSSSEPISTNLPEPKVPAGQYVVNSNTLTSNERSSIDYIATSVIPKLQGDQLTQASVVAWWSLREGTLDRPKPLYLSLCGSSTTNMIVGTECGSGLAWQVGLASSQVRFDRNGITRTPEQIADIAKSLYGSSMSVEDLLSMAATEAGFNPISSQAKAIRNFTGTKRTAWLLHLSPVGFTVAYNDEVNPECFLGRSERITDCYGPSNSGYAKKYAANRTAMMQSIADIREILRRKISGT